MPAFIDVSGQKFGRLTAIEYVSKGFFPNGRERMGWSCECECGKNTFVQSGDLRGGKALSCGCLKAERHTTHGKSKERIYQTWVNMKSRCENLENKDYGGRGISYDPRWCLFEEFYSDMSDSYSDDLTLDRIDLDGNYCKENCRWVTQAVQVRNRGMQSNNKTGVTGVSIWISEYGVKRYLAYVKINRKQKRKSFSTKVYGEEEAFRLAVEQRKAWIEELNAEGAGFSEKHGK